MVTVDPRTLSRGQRERLQRGGASFDEVVLDRTRRVLRGRGRDSDRAKVESFISRMKGVAAGPPVNGSGPTAVSDRTASLRNWGYDPTGRFVE